MPADTDTQKVEATLREHAMSHPGAHEDFPWGHRAIKVKDKTFLFMSVDGAKLSLSTKLPESREAALTLPFTQPTEYGLGKSGWVTARFDSAQNVPVAVLKAWITESYQAIAPKKLAAQAAGKGAATAARAPRAPAKAKAPAGKAVRAKTAAKKAVTQVKKAAKKAVASVKTAAKKATAKKSSARKAAPARGKRQTASAAKRARRS